MTDFEGMVDLVCKEHAHSMRGRFVLLGHSMGALLAYGVAQRLVKMGEVLPSALIASGSAAPARRDWSRLSHENDDDALICDLRKQGGTPEELFADAELTRITLDILAADYRVCKSFLYAKVPPLPVPIHVWAGRSDDIEPEHIQAWSIETGLEMSLDWFDGGHFFIRHQETQVISVLSQRLEFLMAGEGHAPRALA